MDSNKWQTRKRVRLVALALAVGIIVGTVAGCAPFVGSGEPESQNTEDSISQAVAATLDAQSQIERAVAATVAAQQSAGTLNAVTANDAPTTTSAVVRATSTTQPPTPTSAPTYTPRPTPSPTATPTPTPPTLKPTPRPTPTPAWRPPTSQELSELKHLMLELTNAERAKHGAPPVKLGNNPSPQIHAEQGLDNCYASHWDLWGFKPLYRYALTGGDQYADENSSGIDYCPKASDYYRVNHSLLWPVEVRETVEGWINSPGHFRNLVDPRHTTMHAGIAIGKYGNSNMVQVFSGEYITWTDSPSISDATLTVAGQMSEAFWDKDGDYVLATIEWHSPTQRLTPGQLAGTYCLEADVRVGKLFDPLQEGWYYIDDETGREFTDYNTYTTENSQCVNPYELPADRPSPASWEAANAQYDAAVELAYAMPDVEITAYEIVAEQLDVSSDGRTFSIRANLSPILSHYGPGIYTLTIWATMPDGETNPAAEYPIWWHTEPTPGHPY